MTDLTQQQKLEKIIEYAIEQGWKLKDNDGVKRDLSKYNIGVNTNQPVKMVHFINDEMAISRYLERIIFNHNFAKAVFGEEKRMTLERSVNDHQQIEKPAWEVHLKELAITPEDKRIDYIWNTIKEEL